MVPTWRGLHVLDRLAYPGPLPSPFLSCFSTSTLFLCRGPPVPRPPQCAGRCPALCNALASFLTSPLAPQPAPPQAANLTDALANPEVRCNGKEGLG